MLLLLIFLGARAWETHVERTEVDVNFGQDVTITIRFQPQRPIEKVLLFLHPGGTSQTLTDEMSRTGDNTWRLTFAVQEWPLPPFTTVYYWFQVQYADGTTDQTPSFTFVYEDPRFAWETLEAPPFRVYWTGDQMAPAQQVLTAGQEALERMRQQWLAPTPPGIEVYLYPNEEALRVLFQEAPEWAGGFAYPSLAKVFLVAPGSPAGFLDLKRDMAHETAHVVLYAATQGAVARLPWWLQEGLASLAEPQMREEYVLALGQAWKEQTLLSLEALCVLDDWDPDTARLAYAEAASFVQFLHERYGARKLYRLILAYVAGASCNEGVQDVYGKPLTQLETLWQQDVLAYNDDPGIDQKASVVLLWSGVLALVTLSFSAVFLWLRRYV